MNCAKTTRYQLPSGPSVRSPWSSEVTAPEAGRYMPQGRMREPQSECYFLGRKKQGLERAFYKDICKLSQYWKPSCSGEGKTFSRRRQFSQTILWNALYSSGSLMSLKKNCLILIVDLQEVINIYVYVKLHMYYICHCTICTGTWRYTCVCVYSIYTIHTRTHIHQWGPMYPSASGLQWYQLA